MASPRSGANRRRPARLRALEELAHTRGARLYATRTLDALDAAMRELATDPPDVLCINGGDGSVHRVLTSAVQHLPTLPTLALLPGGTMDIAARSTGWLGRGATGLRRVLDGDLTTTERSLMLVDGRWAGFLFGNGLIARFLEVYEEVDDPTALRAAQILGRGAASAVVGGPFAARLTRRWRGEVELDGEVLPGDDWLAVAAGTVEQIGLGFRPFREARAGQLHAVGLGSSVGRFARELPRVYRRRPLREPGNVERAARRLVLRSDEPASFMVDGDHHTGGNELVVEIGPTVRFLVPRAG
jgi:diacylglycerol kinase family enzyme